MAPPPPTVQRAISNGGLPPREVTEDTPVDMLAGSMDLNVILPNNRSVKMSVERR